MDIRKIASVVTISEEALRDNPWTYQKLMEAIRLAPIRRARRLAEETYWQNDEALDNPCVVRGED